MAVMEKKDKVLQQIQASKTADSRAVQDAVSLSEPRPMCYITTYEDNGIDASLRVGKTSP
jgi:hypothetical protein